MRLAVAQVVRIGRLEGETVIDTTAYVQQRTLEPMRVWSGAWPPPASGWSR